MDSVRLDVALVERGIAESRSKAQRMIDDGVIAVNGTVVTKASDRVTDEDHVALVGNTCPYVSRGGLKLEKALDQFHIDPTGYVCGDFGASTGGFTDCLLQHGAAKVYAVDVGFDQLADQLQQDSRVVVMEKTNVRDLLPDAFTERLDLAVIDVSFISLRLVLPIVQRFLKENGQILCLIKPQFEAGRELIGKRGVVRSRKTHVTVLRNFCSNCTMLGLGVQNLAFSPVTGGEGNIEFLAQLSMSHHFETPDLEQIVIQAHQRLRGRL